MPEHSVSVAGVTVDPRGRVLVIQRRDNGHWEAPGGVLELTETPEQGVQREVLEETGVRVRVDRLTGVYKNMAQGVIALVYRCSPQAGHAEPTAEAERVRWITPDEAVGLMTEAYAVRVHDALSEITASRSHDGVQLVDEHAPAP